MTPPPRHIITSDALRACYNVYLENDDWGALFDFFRASPSDWETITMLSEELKDNKFFRDPIYIGRPEENSVARWVYDGTHRACAYLLAEVEEIEVTYEWEDTEEFEAEIETEEYTLVETFICGRDGYTLPSEGDAGPEKIWQTIMSLRIDESTWLVSDFYTSETEAGDPCMYVTWSSEADDIAVNLINLAVWEKLGKFGFDVGRLEITTAHNTYART